MLYAIAFLALTAQSEPLSVQAKSLSAEVRFDSRVYSRAFVASEGAIRLVEYVPRGETLENWTTLIAVRNFTQLADPEAAAGQLARTLRESNPLARFQLLIKEDHSEAVIDFITWSPEGGPAEFNIHRYLRRPGHPGLISYQFAYRFEDSSAEMAATMREMRRRCVDEMIAADFPTDFESR